VCSGYLLFKLLLLFFIARQRSNLSTLCKLTEAETFQLNMEKKKEIKNEAWTKTLARKVEMRGSLFH
jgi:hypothetical protein